MDRIPVCMTLNRHRNEPYLNRIITLVVYHEVLKAGKTINADKYCGQLDQLNDALRSKRPDIL